MDLKCPRIITVISKEKLDLSWLRFGQISIREVYTIKKSKVPGRTSDELIERWFLENRR